MLAPPLPSYMCAPSLVHPEDMAAANAALAARDFMRRQQHREDRRNQAYDQEKEHHQDDQDDQEEVDDARGTTSKEQRKAAVVRRAAEVAVGARRAAGASSTAVTRAAGAAAAVDLELRRWSPPSSKVSSPHSPQSSKGVRSPYQPSNNQNSVSTPPSATSGGGGSAHVARSPSSGAWSSSLRNRSPELSVHSGNSHKDYYGSGGGGGGGSPLSGGGTSSIGSLSERQAWAAALDAAEAEAANKEKEAKRAADREKREVRPRLDICGKRRDSNVELVVALISVKNKVGLDIFHDGVIVYIQRMKCMDSL